MTTRALQPALLMTLTAHLWSAVKLDELTVQAVRPLQHGLGDSTSHAFRIRSSVCELSELTNKHENTFAFRIKGRHRVRNLIVI
jgi:hypothetical protein